MKLLIENWRKFLKEDKFEEDIVGDADYSEEPDYSEPYGESQQEENIESSEELDLEQGLYAAEHEDLYEPPTDWTTASRHRSDAWESLPAGEASAELYDLSYKLDPTGAGQHGGGARAWIRKLQRMPGASYMGINNPRDATAYYKTFILPQLTRAGRPEFVDHTSPDHGSFFHRPADEIGEKTRTPGAGTAWMQTGRLGAPGQKKYTPIAHHEVAHSTQIINPYEGGDARGYTEWALGEEAAGQIADLSSWQDRELRDIFPGMLEQGRHQDWESVGHAERPWEIHAGLTGQRALNTAHWEQGLRDTPDFTADDITTMRIMGRKASDTTAFQSEEGVMAQELAYGAHVQDPSEVLLNPFFPESQTPYMLDNRDLYAALYYLSNQGLTDQQIADRLNRIAVAPTQQQQAPAEIPQSQPGDPRLSGGQETASMFTEGLGKRLFDNWRNYLKEDKNETPT
jgi:hypothetical protein